MEDSSVVAELEGTLIKDPNPFSYFMSIAFEASGLTRFALLLLFWPIIRLLSYLGKEETALKLTIFIAVVGLRESEIRAVGRAVLPKFYLDDIDLDAWRVFSQYDKKVVVTKTPRIMVERFVKEHLMGDEVIGSELDVTRFGFATGLVRDVGSVSGRVTKLFGNEKPTLGLARVGSFGINTFMSLCKETCHPPFLSSHKSVKCDQTRPRPVIFHDGRLVNRQTPATALVVLLWIPFGFVLAIIRTIIVVSLPVWAIPYETPIFGGTLILKGNPPPQLSSTSSSTSTGVLFVCNHRMFLDPVVLAYALGRKIPAVTYSLSRVTEILSSIPTVRLTRDRVTDANMVKKMLQKGDLVVCPEGTTCREPYLLRFSALFAELTNSIVPVAIDCKVGFFHPTKARGWKGLDLLFFLMNPTSLYEVTFLDQLDPEDTCKAGKSPIEVANYVQRRLGETLGFECTKLTRKDKYSLLAENDGTVLSHSKSA